MLVEDFFVKKKKYDVMPSYIIHKGIKFKDQKIGEPFTVYVVFEDMCGLLREYECIITPHKILGIVVDNAFRIKIYKRSKSGYYFELYNKVHYNYMYPLTNSLLFLKGDGSDVHYTRGSYKYVYLDVKEAIKQAKINNASALGDVEHAKDEIERLQLNKREGNIKVNIDNEYYTIHLDKDCFTVDEILDVSFKYDDCKSYNGVVCEYLIVELIKKHLKENRRLG
jgi:hypothetical protein